MSNILKSWKTSLIAIIIICGLGVYGYTNGFSVQDAIYGLIALGFLVSKDNDQTHSDKQSDTDLIGTRPDDR